MQALTGILQAPGVTSAMSRAAIVDLLGNMLGHTSRQRASLGAPSLPPGAKNLRSAVYATVSQAGVVPALMTAYAAASVVQGLDVDKFHFDKFTMRHRIDEVLLKLWEDRECFDGLLAMTEPSSPQCASLSMCKAPQISRKCVRLCDYARGF
jgi:hypothetical protein